MGSQLAAMRSCNSGSVERAEFRVRQQECRDLSGVLYDQRLQLGPRNLYFVHVL